jgi:hypothetical protein
VLASDSGEFSEPWEPAVEPNLIQRWLTGWRLVLVLAALALVYLQWRGGRDYAQFKAWRARGITTKAMAAAAAGDPAKAISLFDEAAILAPLDPTVMRRLVDFCEPRQDINAIHALRQVIRSGEASPADYERLCRLALDMGHAELSHGPTLQAWGQASPDTLSVTQLRLSAIWLASRGQYLEGSDRLRQALVKAEGTDQTLLLQIALARLIIDAASSSGMAENAAQEPLNLLTGVVDSPSAPLALRLEATQLLGGLLLHPARRGLLTPLRADLLRTAFMDLAKEIAPADAKGAVSYELAASTVEYTVYPERRSAIIESVLKKATTADTALPTAGWLNENQCYKEALELCAQFNAGNAADNHAADDNAADSSSGWFTAKLDALFALKSYDEAEDLLNLKVQPLPAHLQQLFLYRLDLAQGRDEATLDARRTALEKAAVLAPPEAVFSAAKNLEQSGDKLTAYNLFSTLKGHPQAALPARLAMVRCLDGLPDRSADLIKTLETVLQLSPQSNEARNDLAYLLLLDGQPTKEELTTAAQLDKDSPRYLSFRVTAALAKLHEEQPAEALALLERDSVPWDRVRPGWQAIYAAALKANGRKEEAQVIAARLKDVALRPGETKWLEK